MSKNPPSENDLAENADQPIGVFFREEILSYEKPKSSSYRHAVSEAKQRKAESDGHIAPMLAPRKVTGMNLEYI